MTFVLAVHGGAGVLRPGDDALDATRRQGLAESLRAGHEVLAAGGGALDAVQRAVEVLEDCPVFNAGRGSVLNSEGVVEMDAALMEGRGRRAGAVAVVRGIAHPIALARAVLEDGRHVLLAGQGVLRFARERGVETVEPASLVTPARLAQLEDARSRQKVLLDADEGETVGAVARDARGALAAATSTGGMTNKLPGRVGDSPLVGSGTWADDVCAVSGTGRGEVFVRAAFAHELSALVRLAAVPLAQAAAQSLAAVRALGGTGGCVAVGARGQPVLVHDTPGMPRGRIGSDGRPKVAIYREEALAVSGSRDSSATSSDNATTR